MLQNKLLQSLSSSDQRIESDADVVRVRQTVRALGLQAKLSIVDQTKLVTAASELARNTFLHGGGGYARLELVRSGDHLGVRALFVDEGPGITDLDRALSGGYTTKNGLGLGLSGSRRLVDEFDVETKPGAGTTVTVVKWKR